MTPFSSMADSFVAERQTVAVYCRSGKRSKKAAAILSKKGYKSLSLIKDLIPGRKLVRK